MKENVLDVLMYLFENYLEDHNEYQPDRDTLKVELEEAGFADREVSRAFTWLEDLACNAGDASRPIHTHTAMRIFHPAEIELMDCESRGYIVYLEQIGILSQAQRELVIDQIMALGANEIDIDQTKWIILMVLFNQPGQETAYARMEDLVFEESVGAVH